MHSFWLIFQYVFLRWLLRLRFFKKNLAYSSLVKKMGLI